MLPSNSLKFSSGYKMDTIHTQPCRRKKTQSILKDTPPCTYPVQKRGVRPQTGASQACENQNSKGLLLQQLLSQPLSGWQHRTLRRDGNILIIPKGGSTKYSLSGYIEMHNTHFRYFIVKRCEDPAFIVLHNHIPPCGALSNGKMCKSKINESNESSAAITSHDTCMLQGP